MLVVSAGALVLWLLMLVESWYAVISRLVQVRRWWMRSGQATTFEEGGDGAPPDGDGEFVLKSVGG